MVQKWGEIKNQKNRVFLVNQDVGKGYRVAQTPRVAIKRIRACFLERLYSKPASQLFSNWFVETVKPRCREVLTLTGSFPR